MIPLFKPYMPEDILEDINEILFSGKLAFGKWGKLFEQEIALYLGTENISVVNSYSSALNIALEIFNINAGDEIIMSPMCCLQSTQPLAAKRIKIVWADVDPFTGTLDPTSVKNRITDKTKAIFHNQHLGYVGYIDEINKIAEEFGIYTIDDCVDGMGGIYKGNKVGNCGSDATIISFHAVRLPNALEGGAVVFKQEQHTVKANVIRDLGLERPLFRDDLGEINENYDVTTIGYGATTNEVNTYIGWKQMEKLDSLHKKQRDNATNWENYFVNNNITAQPISIVSETVPFYWVFGFFTENKLELMADFRNRGYYCSAVHLNNNRYSVFGEQIQFPGVTEFYRKFLALPVGWWMDVKL